MTPIFDRTVYDLETRTPKAHLNATDANRIEGNMAQLAEWVGAVIATKAFTRTDFFREADHARWIANTDTLRGIYPPYPSTPQTPDYPINDIYKLNDIERIVYDIHKKYNAEQMSFIYTGEGYAGDDIGVI